MKKFLLVLFFLALMKPVFTEEEQKNAEEGQELAEAAPTEEAAGGEPDAQGDGEPDAQDDGEPDAQPPAEGEENILYHNIVGSCHLGEHLCLYDCCYYAWDGRNRCCHYKPWSPCCVAYGSSHSAVYNYYHQLAHHHHDPSHVHVVPVAAHTHVHY